MYSVLDCGRYEYETLKGKEYFGAGRTSEWREWGDLRVISSFPRVVIKAIPYLLGSELKKNTFPPY